MDAKTEAGAARELPAAERLDESVRDALAAAIDLARLTHHPAVGAGHLALALLSAGESTVDPLLDEAFPGVRASILAESLLDVLEIEAEQSGSAAGSFPETGLPRREDLSAGALAAVERAAAVAAEWGLERVSRESLLAALFQDPPPALGEAFRDAGVSPTEVRTLGAGMAAGGSPAPSAEPPAVFRDGAVDPRAFGAAVTGAFAELARRAAARPGDRFSDADLLAALLGQEGSRLAAGLHVMGLPVTSIRRQLTRDATPAPAATAASGPGGLPEERLSRLLRRVLSQAAALAAAEGTPAITESQLVRAHLERVAGGAGNLYQRLGIDTLRLRDYLRRYADDPESAEPATSAAPAVGDVEEHLSRRVINQKAAIERATPALRRIRVGLSAPGRPAGVFLFLGPTGVGKTELAKAIAEVAFGAEPGSPEKHLIKLDCGNFKEDRDIVQLLGAPQGLVGYKEGQLTNGLKAKPRAVILFDEAEKAHRQIWQSLLPLFDEGIVREADGTEYDASPCILIATSNLGYGEAIERFRLWDDELDGGALPGEVTDFVWGRVEEYFSPEFLGRFGRENVLFFNHFDRSGYRTLVQLESAELQREMAGEGFEVGVPEEVVERLAELAWERREEGARPVGRLVTTRLRDRIVNALLAEPERTRFTFTTLQGRGEILLEG